MSHSSRGLPGWLASLLLILAIHAGLGYWAWFWTPASAASSTERPVMLVQLAPMAVPVPARPASPPPAAAPAPPPAKAQQVSKPKPVQQTAKSPEKPAQPALTTVAQAQPTAAPAINPPAPNTPVQAPSTALPNWQSQLFSHLSRYQHYPAAAKRSAPAGQRICTLRFVLDGQGRVLQSEVLISSGNRHLDRASRDMLKRAQPLPAPPAELLSNGLLEIEVPIVYALNARDS